MTTKRVVADDMSVKFNDRRWELERRLREGTLNPEKVLEGLQELIETCSWPRPKFPIWRTITHRGRRNADSYRAGLSSAHYKVSVFTNDFLGRFETTSVDEEVDLGCTSVADLGFTKDTSSDMICDRIIALGHGLCLPEDGPVLREQYLEQPKDEWLELAMKSIRDSHGYMAIFCVAHNESGLGLFKSSSGPVSLWNPVHRFVFRLSKRPLVA